MAVLMDHAEIYPKVVQIAAEESALQLAMPLLEKVAIEHKTKLVRLVDWYLDLCPDQERYCETCEEWKPVADFCLEQCQECALAEAMP